MALFDTRTFQTGGEWWIAQVHGSVGAGWGEGFQPSSETVYFTSASDESRESVHIQLPAETLNAMSHRSIVAALRAAKPFHHRLPMSPTNAPDVERLARDNVITDEEGLRWVLREARMPWFKGRNAQPLAVTEAICLDDSALRGFVGLAEGAVPTPLDVISAVKAGFQDVEPRR